MRPKLATVAWLYVLPAFVLLGVFLVYPVVNTIYLSFFGRDVLPNSSVSTTTSTCSLTPRRSSSFVTICCGSCSSPRATVALGLVLAVLANQVRYEAIAKAIIFVPMAVSFTAAAVIWRFMYIYRAPGVRPDRSVQRGPAGLGLDPVPWITNTSVNNYALIAAGIWMWTGFALVVVSAGLKGIPDRGPRGCPRRRSQRDTDLLAGDPADAALRDARRRSHAHDQLPQGVRPRLRHDVRQLRDTDVLANRMFKEMFTFGNFGRASAVAVVLLLAIFPLMLSNIRRFRREQ
jgi:alpha-glucoside transport system permease protein